MQRLAPISVSDPKAAAKSGGGYVVSNILPNYFAVLASERQDVSEDGSACWFCRQPLEPDGARRIETLFSRSFGYFCSRICADSFAAGVKHIIPLREDPKVSLLPLVCYRHPERVLAVINGLRDTAGVYGGVLFAKNRIDIELKSFI
ncbi:late transcription factor VLTF-2 [Nile crocodilepox virus]|uniref:Viral late gene transcription factor 2 n=1 Tax=Nile crocodilepox virus (isolate Crocodylus niloticus/Zimbabwe/Ume/2001) TaxID=1289473 RepID=Q070D0_CPRVZ|nr:late transcription factor VLTF-2 [Nile crocodilepox virus]ABJ09012.1 late transcription factor VLTF-2 [Nile crocodilepox virus]